MKIGEVYQRNDYHKDFGRPRYFIIIENIIGTVIHSRRICPKSLIHDIIWWQVEEFESCFERIKK